MDTTDEAGLIEVPAGTNSRGLREVGCLPNLGPGLSDAGATGLGAAEIPGGGMTTLLLFQSDPIRTHPDPEAWEQALDDATGVVAFADFLTPALEEHATVVFPAESYAEKEGTVTHPDGRLQRVRQAIAQAAEHSQSAEIFLTRLARGTSIRVLGYVEDVRRLMAAADLLVTKAGGMTLAEAMAAELPMLLYGSLPGQERRNERFASRAGIALAARSRRDLRRLLERALGEPALLEHLRDGSRRLRRPDATRRIVDAVLEHCRQLS